MEKMDLGSPDPFIIHLGTNDLRTAINLDFVLGEVYELASMANRKLPNCRLVLSVVLRRRDVTWRRTGALNDRFDREPNDLGLTFCDPNSWIEDGDFARDGFHLNGRGKRRFGQIYARVSGLDVGGSADCKMGQILNDGNHRTRDSRETRRSAIEEQKTLHEVDGPETSILMSRKLNLRHRHIGQKGFPAKGHLGRRGRRQHRHTRRRAGKWLRVTSRQQSRRGGKPKIKQKRKV